MDQVTEQGPPKIRYDHGVHLEGTLLWFDPSRVRDFCAVTSARVPLGKRQTKVLWGDKTARILAASQGRKMRGLVCPYNRAFSMGNLTIELFPSGYVAGAAQFQVRLPDGRTLIYSGPTSMVKNRTAERIETRHCDTLIVDATYGHEQYTFPSRTAVEKDVVAWAQQALHDGFTPIILAGNPGKAQDVIHLLGSHKLSVRVHRAIYGFNKAYRSVGVDLPNCKQFRGHPAHGEVLVWPAHLRKSPAIRNLRKTRLAAMTGAGVMPGIARRLRVSKVFTWSLRSDYEGLLTYIRKVKPSSVVTYGNHASDLSERLQAKGMSARPLIQTDQMTLL